MLVTPFVRSNGSPEFDRASTAIQKNVTPLSLVASRQLETFMNAPSWLPAELSTDTPPRWASVLLALATASALLPLVFAIALYGEYLLAWLQLGHAPLPSLDDPRGIPGHSVLHTAVAILFLCLPAALLMSLITSIGSILLKLETASRRAVRMGATLALWVLLSALLRSDPLGVVYWWMD